jgi:hypothetical protein
MLNLKKEDYSKYLEIKTIFGKRLRVICVPQDLVENTIYSSCDGLEDRMVAKDLLYKFNEWVVRNKQRSIISLVRNPEINHRGKVVLRPHIRTWFKQFQATLENYRGEV